MTLFSGELGSCRAGWRRSRLELTAYRDALNPAAIGREIADLQAVLLKLAKDKTEQHYVATFPSALPDVHKGVRILKPKAS